MATLNLSEIFGPLPFAVLVGDLGAPEAAG
jgi:hypothetical protein